MAMAMEVVAVAMAEAIAAVRPHLPAMPELLEWLEQPTASILAVES